MKRKREFSRVGALALFLRGAKGFFIISIVSSLALSLAQMVLPRIVSVTVDSIIGDAPPEYAVVVEKLGGIAYLREHLWVIAVLVAALGLCEALMRYLSRFFNAKGAERMNKTMRDRLFERVLRLPLSWHMQNRTGDIIQRCTSDVETTLNFVSEQLTELISILILVGVSLFSVFSIHPKLALLTLFAIPVVVLISYIFYRSVSNRFSACDESEGVLSAVAQENLTGSRVVKAFGREAYERDKFARQNADYTDKWIRLCRILSVYWGGTDFIACGQVCAVLVCGVLCCRNGSLLPGQLIAFITYNTMLIWPVRQLGRMISDMSKAGVAIDRIRYILNSEPEQNEGECRPYVDGDIVFENVTFGYTDHEVFKNVSFTLKKGQTLGVLGTTGAGKTTLILLLTRLCVPQSGCITVGGVDIRDIDLYDLRRHIGVVMQEPFLFTGTLSENIGITRDDASEKELHSAAAVACLEETIENFSAGYDTLVGERGVTLSGGQKQRTAIARMLMMNTPVMVMDDSLSAVDTETDARIRAGLAERFGDATVILISHRVSTLMAADLILVMEKGTVTEMGTHDELLALGGHYARVFEMQTTLPEELRGI